MLGVKICCAKGIGVFMLDVTDKLLVDKFCYLGDMLGKGDGAEQTTRT